VPNPKKQHSLIVEVFSDRFLESFGPGYIECSNQNQYSDLDIGAQVIVKNEKSIIIAKGKLVGWFALDTFWYEERLRFCKLKSSVIKIPISKFYEIQVGANKSETYTHSELVAKKWLLKLEL
jgi:hypothetical protein